MTLLDTFASPLFNSNLHFCRGRVLLEKGPFCESFQNLPCYTKPGKFHFVVIFFLCWFPMKSCLI